VSFRSLYRLPRFVRVRFRPGTSGLSSSPSGLYCAYAYARALLRNFLQYQVAPANPHGCFRVDTTSAYWRSSARAQWGHPTCRLLGLLIPAPVVLADYALDRAMCYVLGGPFHYLPVLPSLLHLQQVGDPQTLSSSERYVLALRRYHAPNFCPHDLEADPKYPCINPSHTHVEIQQIQPRLAGPQLRILREYDGPHNDQTHELELLALRIGATADQVKRYFMRRRRNNSH
jgi:hypothetical protein